jgi:hypothetical protein
MGTCGIGGGALAREYSTVWEDDLKSRFSAIARGRSTALKTGFWIFAVVD